MRGVTEAREIMRDDDLPAFLDRRAGKVELIELARIRADQRAQPRDHLNTEITEGYAEDMATGAEFPPLVVFFDGASYWLADGFHRHYAAHGCGLVEFACEVHPGGLREAILHSCGANAAHGYRRSNDDKRRAVRRMLEDEEWRGWSERDIARQCKVSHTLVQKMKGEYLATLPDSSARTVKRGGSTYTMNTAAIGRKPMADLPVFGQSKSGERVSAERPPKWSPEDIAPAQQQRLQHDNTHGWLSTLLWDVEEAVSKLPDPQAAARDFPSHHRHTMTSEQARKIAAWFSEFADAWADQHEGAVNVAAE